MRRPRGWPTGRRRRPGGGEIGLGFGGWRGPGRPGQAAALGRWRRPWAAGPGLLGRALRRAAPPPPPPPPPRPRPPKGRTRCLDDVRRAGGAAASYSECSNRSRATPALLRRPRASRHSPVPAHASSKRPRRRAARRWTGSVWLGVKVMAFSNSSRRSCLGGGGGGGGGGGVGWVGAWRGGSGVKLDKQDGGGRAAAGRSPLLVSGHPLDHPPRGAAPAPPPPRHRRPLHPKKAPRARSRRRTSAARRTRRS
jgi:hypothetical protein